jgi:hypothetical protein
MSHFIFRNMAYGMNDDWMQNLLYSGSFTNGVAISENLFQFQYFIDLLVWMNNQLSNIVNWYYYVHFIFLWFPIVAYLLKFNNLKKLNIQSVISDIEFWVWLFLGVWMVKTFTFTWIASMAAIISWLWFWRQEKKKVLDWIFISLSLIISICVRPQSFMLINVMAVVIMLVNKIAFVDLSNVFRILKEIAKKTIVPFLFLFILYTFFIKNHIDYANEKKFPFAWVAEESHLMSILLNENGGNYDEIDYNLSKRFFFDDRFQDLEVKGRQEIVFQALRNAPYRYIKKVTLRFFHETSDILFSLMVIAMLVSVLVLSETRNIKKIIFTFLVIIAFFGSMYLLTNLHILKERVILPPIFFLFLFYLSKVEMVKLNYAKQKVLFVILITTMVVQIAKGVSVNQIVSSSKISMLKMLPEDNLLLINADLSVLDANAPRVCVNLLRFNVMPMGWGMRSSTFNTILQKKGISNIHEGIEAGKIGFLLGTYPIEKTYSDYFEKYFPNDSFSCNKIMVNDNQRFIYSLKP